MDMKMDEFLEVLGSAAPVPGGGGACGYVAAIGMALGCMVANLTTGKKKYAQYQDEIEESIKKAEALVKELADCMEKDAVSFEPLSKAYGLPKNTPEEVAYRDEVMEKALVVAAEAPINMMETILESLKLLDRLAVIGSRIALSDIGVGVKMCGAAMDGASLNVYINTGMMKDRQKAQELNMRADSMVAEAAKMAEAAYAYVLKEIRK